MKKTIVTILLLCLLATGALALSACNEAGKYNAVLYSGADDWFLGEFLDAHRTKGAFYPNENYIEGISSWNDRYIKDNTSPSTYQCVIDNEEDFGKVFAEFPPRVNFAEDMLVVYFYTETDPKELRLDRLTLEDGALRVECKFPFSTKNDTVAPYRNCLVLKMDKVEILTVEFVID